MNARRLFARMTAVSATTVVVASGLTTSAWAGALTVTSGSPALNTGTGTVVVDAASQYVPSVPSITMTLTRHGTSAPEDRLQTTSATASSNTHTITGTIDFTQANPGVYDVRVEQGGSQDSCQSCLTVNGFSPSVSSVTPAVLGEGTRDGGFQNFVINGQGFAKGLYAQCASAPCSGPSVAVFRSGTTTSDPNVALTQTVASGGGSAPTPTTPSAITLRINVTNTDNVADYTDDIVVTNSDGKSGKCASCLTIRPQPTITSVDLQTADFPGNVLHVIGQNAVSQTVVVRGDNFPADSFVQFIRPDGAPAGQPIAVGSATPPQPDGAHQQITLTGVDTTGVVTPGNWKVIVSSASLHSASAPIVFPVVAKPVGTGLDEVDSSTGAYGQGARQVRVDVFVDRATPFYGGAGASPHTLVRFFGLPAGAVVSNQTASFGVGADDNVVRSTLDIPEGTALQDYEVMVVNPDGGRSPRCDNSTPGPLPPATPNTCVLSVEAGPRVDAVNPNTKAPGFSGNVDVLGGNFHGGTDGVHVRIGSAGAPLFDGDLTATNSGKVTVPLTIPANAVPQNLDVLLTNNDDRGSDLRTGLFHVTTLTAGNPSPSSGTNDAPVSVSLTGNNIASNASVAMVMDGVPSIPGSSVVVGGGGTTLTATFNLTNRAPGAYDVLVTNPTAPNAGTGGCSQCFLVQALAPTVSTVSPASMGAGASNQTVTISGAHLFPGASVTFSNSAIHPVGSPAVSAPGTVTQAISIDQGTAADPTGTVTVTNTDGQSAGHLFGINTGPFVSGINPSKRAAGSAQFLMSVSGSNFANGATLAFSDPTVSASGYTVSAGGGTLSALVTVPAGVAPTSAVPVGVTVVNPDKGRGSSPTPLTVTPRPVIDHTAPSGMRSGTSGPVQIVGTGFAETAMVTSDDPGVTITNVHYVGPTEIDVIAAVAATEPVGPRNLTVNNGDGGAATHAFGVFTAPDAPASATATAGDHVLSIAWTAPAFEGGDPITSYTVRLSRHADGVPVASYTSSDGTARSHGFAGLVNGVRYDASVTAANGAGSGAAATAHGRPKWVTRLSLHRSDRRIAAGDAVRIFGVLHRSDGSGLANAAVKVFRTLAGHPRHRLAIVQTGPDGSWSLRDRPRHRASYDAVFPGDRADRRAVSRTRTVRVH